MNKKLSKNAMYLIGIIILIIMTFTVIWFARGTSENDEKKEVTTKLESLVSENQVLKVKLLDFVSEKTYQEGYQEVNLTIDKDEEVAGLVISQKQVFTKIMQLLPPDDTSPLLNQASNKATHNAYVLVLMGDIAKYKDTNGKETYKIVNGRLDYYKQALLLENEYDSVYIASIDGKKEKMVKLPAYKEALSDVTKYMTMLQW